ncbi:MAG: histidinol dehydrogenase [Agriterribacter sp.]
MNIVSNPPVAEWKKLLQRPTIDNTFLENAVANVLKEVKRNGDKALLDFTQRFDGVLINDLKVSLQETENAGKVLNTSLKNAILQAKKNIETFHQKQIQPAEIITTMPGVECWRKSVGIERVGLYIPGGSAPLFSTVLMLGIPAAIAGCKEIILCTPPDKNGNIHPAILFAAKTAGITQVYKVGGAQAIAAMAFGTETIAPVYKIFGPGNQYVTCAKQMIQREGIAIDMPAGPSEVCVLADEAANTAYVAADLLSQAEHGADSQVLLISTSEDVASAIVKETTRQLQLLPRKEMAEKALANSTAIIVDDMKTAVALINEYAPEHLIISSKNDEQIAESITNAGSVFLGNYSPESVGDYASGTNHTLPTNGYAKAYSGVSVDSFVKKITYQKLSKEGLNAIADTVIQMAEAEGLEAHANAVRIRI